jgi:hypothetical protein
MKIKNAENSNNNYMEAVFADKKKFLFLPLNLRE